MVALKMDESDQPLAKPDDEKSADASAPEAIYLHQLSLPLSQSVACSVCGKLFEISRQRGRPQRFCGNDCRQSQHRQQKADWSKANWLANRGTAGKASG